MSADSRKLNVGDFALTDYNGRPLKRVQIIERIDNVNSGSRTMFRVQPPLRNGTAQSWYDADWFEPDLPT